MATDSSAVEDFRRQANRLQTLAESSHAFAEAAVDLDRLLHFVARRFADLIGDGCYIRLVGSDGVSLVPVATYHPDPEIERYLRETTDRLPLRVGEGISGRVVETGQSCFMPHVPFEQYRAMTKPEFVPIFERIGVTSLIVVCLRARSTSLGFIALVRNGTGRPAYTDDDLQLVQDLADRAALAIDNARLVADLERRVAERTRELEGANRELEAFTYSVSHDLRAPLRAIDGFSRMLEEDHGELLDGEARRALMVIRRNTHRMAQLIEDLLRFSRARRGTVGPVTDVPMRAMVDSVIADLREAEPSRTIELRIGELPSARCNGDLVRQVWANLIGNAVKYTRGQPTAIIEISGETDQAESRYTVTDNGPGFPPEDAARVFEVFQRLHSAAEFEGTGVGLALVERIVTRHGGRVWAVGRPGVGATFGFALPRPGAS